MKRTSSIEVSASIAKHEREKAKQLKREQKRQKKLERKGSKQ